MRLTALIVLFLLLLGCQQDAGEPTANGHVYANAAYRQHFGEPPIPKAGVGFARVGYLPTSKQPGKLKAIPLFLFTEENQLELILGQLFSSDLILSPRSGLLGLAGWGISLEKIAQEGDSVRVFLRTVAHSQVVNTDLIARAITETAAQFPDVSRVSVRFAGEKLPSEPEGGFQGEDSYILPAGSPDLIGVFGSWEPGETDPKEVQVIFNRPIMVNSVQVLDGSGQSVAGDYYTSMFDMAVVLHPAQPENFSSGSELQIEWDVSDQLGRQSSGTDRLRLKRTDHLH